MADEIKIQYDAATLYARVYDSTGQVWNTSGTPAFEAWADGNVADYVISLTDQDSGEHLGDFPSDISAGVYQIIAYEGSGALSDIAVSSVGTIWWNGTSEETQTEYELNSYDPPTKTEMDGAFTEIKGATWDAGTDTLEDIRDKQTDIETDTAEIGAAGAGLTDLGGMSAGMKAEVNTEADTALTDYDPPTKTEMDDAFTEIKGATWDAGTDTLEDIRDKQTDIETDTAEIGVAGDGLTDLGGMSAGMKAEVNTEADTALTDYDPPTKTEMDDAFTEIKGATWDAGTDTLEDIRDDISNRVEMNVDHEVVKVSDS